MCVHYRESQENLKSGSWYVAGAEPTSELTSGSYESSLPGSSLLVGLGKEDIPGASLNGCVPCLLPCCGALSTSPEKSHCTQRQLGLRKKLVHAWLKKNAALYIMRQYLETNKILHEEVDIDSCPVVGMDYGRTALALPLAPSLALTLS